MKAPLLVCVFDTLWVLNDHFKYVGRLDLLEHVADINVTDAGTAGLHWIIDTDGFFYELKSMGVLPRSFLQTVSFSRRRERYEICPARRISVAELRDRISDLEDQFEEAPVVTDLKKLLAILPKEKFLGPEEVRRYLGI